PQRLSLKNPHARLRIVNPSQKNDGHRQTQKFVAEAVLEGHGADVLERKSRCGEKAYIGTKEYFEQIGDAVHRIRVIAIQGHYNVSMGLKESGLVRSSIPANLFM